MRRVRHTRITLPRDVRGIGRLLALAAVETALTVIAAWAGGTGPQCSTLQASDCTTAGCWVSCPSGTGSELELRRAVHAANLCSPNPDFSRNIYFGGFTDRCQIKLKNEASSSVDPTTGQQIAICQDLPDPPYPHRYGICLTGHDIFISGGNVVDFVYDGPVVCTSALNSLGPPAFVLEGNHNSVFAVSTAFFPEGIDVRRGSDHIVENVRSDYYCDEAVAIDSPATNARVNFGTFTGHTGSSRCEHMVNNVRYYTCGFDKAIQIRGGSSQIRRNTFMSAQYPIQVNAGVHTITENTITGLEPGTCPDPPYNCHEPQKDNFCVGILVDGGSVTATGNYLQFCKFGIEIRGGGSIQATSNTVKDGYISGFRVGGGGTLTGSDNRIKGAGFFDGSSSCKGGLVVEDNFGGISVDFSGNNRFCQKPANSRDGQNHTDIRNIGNLTNCNSNTNYSIRAANDCFDNGVDKVGPVDVSGNSTGCDCNF